MLFAYFKNGPNKLKDYTVFCWKGTSETDKLAYFGTFQHDEKSFVTLPGARCRNVEPEHETGRGLSLPQRRRSGAAPRRKKPDGRRRHGKK